jgi:hypothetical protein
MSQVRDAGLQDMRATDDAGPTSVAIEMVMSAYKSGKLFAILSGILVEQGTEWSIEAAARTADLLKKIKDPEEKKVLNAALVGTLVRFFVHAVAYPKTSLSASADAGSEKPNESDRVVLETSASGMESSVDSQDRTHESSMTS